MRTNLLLLGAVSTLFPIMFWVNFGTVFPWTYVIEVAVLMGFMCVLELTLYNPVRREE